MLNVLPSYCLSILILFFFLIGSGCTTSKAKNPVEVNKDARWVEACTDWDEWDKPGPPFKIFGNSYYVGSCGITAILVTSDEGHVLFDGGTQAGADIIAENIKTLGFSLTDVRLLLHSHEHFDHAAGLAKLQQLSGARLLASSPAAPVFRTGVVANADPQAGTHEPFPIARVDGLVADGHTVTLGQLSFNPIATPGHSPGALSWQWQSCEKERCLSIVYADSLSPVSGDNYRFSDYPNYVDAYRLGLYKLAKLECQILLAPHPSAASMRKRLLSLEGLIDPQNCISYAKAVSNKLDKRIAKEQMQQLMLDRANSRTNK